MVRCTSAPKAEAFFRLIDVQLSAISVYHQAKLLTVAAL